jgi:hypothetical protein
MAVYQENPDGTISTIVEDTTIGQIESRIKESLCLDSSCGAEIRASISKVTPIIEIVIPTEEV